MKVNKGKQNQLHISSFQMHAVLKTSEERYYSSLKTNTGIFVGPFCRQLNTTHSNKIHTYLRVCYTTEIEGYSLREDRLILHCSVKITKQLCKKQFEG